MIILFLNHKVKSCGVYQYGLRVFNILKNSKINTYIYKEIDSFNGFNEYIQLIYKFQYDLILYNYHTSTMPWLNHNTIQKQVKNIGIPHETKPTFFDCILTIDPDEVETTYSYNIPRPIYENISNIIDNYEIKNNQIIQFINYNEGNDIPIFGSFGFGFLNKGFDKIISHINSNYDSAIIKLLITFAEFDGDRLKNVSNIVNICNSIPLKPNIKLLISHEFFTNEEILMFLNSNTCNIFLYETTPNRGQIIGISSVIDYAISVNKPIIISDSIMFRNIYTDDICIYKTNIKEAIENSRKIIPKFIEKYSNDKLINKVDKIILTTTNFTKLKGIFYNSKKALCSIHESGLMVFNCLKHSTFYDLTYTEDTEFIYDYDFAIVNEHFTVNNWVTKDMVIKFNKPVFCIVTEITFTEKYIDSSPNFYTAYLLLDSSINEKNNIYGFPRPLNDYPIQPYIPKDIPIIGSFGFATAGKEWHKIVEETQKDFDNAIIRFNIPFASYVPNTSNEINHIVEKCKNILVKPGINVIISQHNFTNQELIDWCSQNTINCFFYNREHLFSSGLCATADQAIISERPLLVSKDRTFRHIHKYLDYYPNISIKEAIDKSLDGVKKMKTDWSCDIFKCKFEKILFKYYQK